MQADNNRPTKLIVLGGAGYVGSRLTENLTEKGLEVVVADKSPRSGQILCEDLRCLSVDYLSEFDVIILLAGHSSVALANREPTDALDNKVVQFQALLGNFIGPMPYSGAPGYAVPITFTVTAPSSPGVYPMQWRMMESGVYFGDMSDLYEIQVI